MNSELIFKFGIKVDCWFPFLIYLIKVNYTVDFNFIQGYTVPSPGSLSNSDSMGYPPQRSLYQYNKAVQTDVEYVNTGEHKDNRIEDLLRVRLRRSQWAVMCTNL